jgi:hypothetical protein
VRESDEPEIRAAFEKTLVVRRLGAEARALADYYFYETLVRVHRAGEGEPYTGLKPAGRDPGPAIPAADKAIESGSPENLIELIADAAQHGVEERFQDVLRAKAMQNRDVRSGREYVAAYVAFIHYVETLFESATVASHGR